MPLRRLRLRPVRASLMRRCCRCCRCPSSGSRSSTTSACTRWSSLGLVLLTGDRRPDVVRPGGVRRHRRLHRRLPDGDLGVSPWLALLIGLGLTGARRAGARPDHAAHVGPLPAAGHHRLGPVAVLPDGQHRLRSASTTACWASRRSSFFGIDARHGPRLLLLIWASSCWPPGAVCTCSIRAPGRAIRALQGRHADGRGDGHHHLPLQGRCS